MEQFSGMKNKQDTPVTKRRNAESGENGDAVMIYGYILFLIP
jgi:hypothetical protein